ncbi:MAG: NAD synthetase [Candidatus Dadabacteria bacterium]|nr:NAD synthetase [Candidatus Dadabacteria bacterium]NIQ13707.1 NAD synthetase [Candidatus Dadabacteria bacterium]
MSVATVNIAYLLAACLFIFGLKGLSHPRTAVRGNLLGAMGMLLAIVVTLLNEKIVSYEIIFAGIIVGGAIGAILSVKIKITSMPQLVALFNGFGGGASVLVAGVVFAETMGIRTTDISAHFTIATIASCLIGAVTFWGSLLAFAKLQGMIGEKPSRFTGSQILKILFSLAALVVGYFILKQPELTYFFWILVLVSSILGILLVAPIGGADMPVVIALLNSFSGLAAAATGFILYNNVLIIAGTLVGASGIILTNIMCRAMNRKLKDVIFGEFGAISQPGNSDDIYEGKVKSTTPEEVSLILEGANRVVVAPGYGMAVAQAQFAVRDLYNILEDKGTNVEFAIHPVAGRMPGHMNVLLAEADIPYDKLKEMDEINPRFNQVDVTLVIGANDVVNPVARTDPSSPIAGMPILDVDKSKIVIVIKRSLSAGFAGIPNPLFAQDNSLMLFGDGKEMVEAINKNLKDLY